MYAVCNTSYTPTANSQKTCGSICSKIYCKERQKNHNKKLRTKSLESNLKQIVRVIVNRSKKYDNCNINYDYILDLAIKQDWKCSKTGINFTISIDGDKNPWQASIDQINPSKGYTKDNIQLVCMMYNYSKHTYKDEDVLIFAKELIKHQNTKMGEDYE